MLPPKRRHTSPDLVYLLGTSEFKKWRPKSPSPVPNFLLKYWILMAPWSQFIQQSVWSVMVWNVSVLVNTCIKPGNWSELLDRVYEQAYPVFGPLLEEVRLPFPSFSNSSRWIRPWPAGRRPARRRPPVSLTAIRWSWTRRPMPPSLITYARRSSTWESSPRPSGSVSCNMPRLFSTSANIPVLNWRHRRNRKERDFSFRMYPNKLSPLSFSTVPSFHIDKVASARYKAGNWNKTNSGRPPLSDGKDPLNWRYRKLLELRNTPTNDRTSPVKYKTRQWSSKNEKRGGNFSFLKYQEQIEEFP